MKRALKILLAFSCCVLGCCLCFDPGYAPVVDLDGWNVVLTTFGLLLMITAGLYGTLKLAKPLLFPANERTHFHRRK